MSYVLEAIPILALSRLAIISRLIRSLRPLMSCSLHRKRTVSSTQLSVKRMYTRGRTSTDSMENLSSRSLSAGSGHLFDLCSFFAGSLQQNLFNHAAVVLVGNWKMHFLPDKRKVACVVVDGFFEDLRVGDGHDPTGVLPGLHPHPRVGILHARRLAHFHNHCLYEVKGDHIPADSTHRDSVADVEGLSTKDDEIPCKASDDLLQGKREPRAHKSYPCRKSGWVVEPDGYKSQKSKHEGN